MDFDKSSLEWRKNKKYLGKGLFSYLCNYIHSNGKKCKKIIASSSNYMINNIFFKKYINHPNQYYYCKRHLNRKRI
jgi:DNA primase large subunit